MAEILDFDAVHAADTTSDGNRIVLVLKRGAENVNVTLPTVEVLRLLLAAIAGQKLAIERLGTPLAPKSSLSFDACEIDLFPDQGMARLTFHLPGGVHFPLQVTIPNARSLVTTLSQALELTPKNPQSSTHH